MCGINGYVTLQGNNDVSLVTMNEMLHHRGPDDSGTVTGQGAALNYWWGMGMVRLAIIDLDGGSQPMQSADKMITLTFNGEIYNYKVLRSYLEKRNYSFNTNSDTEVILALYETEGRKGLERLDGMYAISIHDMRLKKIFLARDFFGEKPLYYIQKNDRIIWSSEIQPLLPYSNCEISRVGLRKYFSENFIPAPHSIFEDILKLPRNSVLEIDCETFSTNILPIHLIPSKTTLLQDNLNIKESIEALVESRLVSDVKIGILLSGGLDSSIVLACSRKNQVPITTYTASFPDSQYDESKFADELSKKFRTTHRKVYLNQSDLLDSFIFLAENLGEPLADPAMLPLYHLTKRAKSDGVKVLLGGDGADELFGGYRRYNYIYYERLLNYIIPKFLKRFVVRLVRILGRKILPSRKYIRLEKFLEAYLAKGYDSISKLGLDFNSLDELLNFTVTQEESRIIKSGSLAEMRDIDLDNSLEGGLLPKGDRVSMLNSVELRAPFLSRDLYETLRNLPDRLFRSKGKFNKANLKEAFENSFRQGFFNRPKSGFDIDINSLVKELLKSKANLDFFEKTYLEKQGLFNYETVNRLLKKSERNYSENLTIYKFILFQIWVINIKL